ncbi:MAG: divalent cation tolerance protein CutA [Schwartzia sp.]|nr:divalent cation tolerance protein CutA [Schwartzia sp. (in: firmicutes)]
MNAQYYKLEIFIPETHFHALQKALTEADAGHIGNYDSCLAYSRVTGTWRPLSGTKPFIGVEGEISEEPELKVEVTIRTEILDAVMKAIKAIHPYEEPLINVLPLVATGMDID